MIEVIEILAECVEDDSDSYNYVTGKHMKTVAYIANGIPHLVGGGVALQRTYRNKEQFKKLTNLTN